MKLITKEEMEKAIKNILKNEKSSGEDKIVNEYLTHSTNSIFDIYVKLCNALFDSGIIPEQWLLGNIIPVYNNKGSKVDPNFFRPIILANYLHRF
jgi:hypothetical protein